MLGKLFGWAILFGLMMGIWALSDTFDDIYMNWAKPPIASPASAPLPVPMYKNAAIMDDGVEEIASGSSNGWTYHWDLESPWPIDSVVDFYRTATDGEPQSLHSGDFLFKYVPPKAQEGEYIEVTLYPMSSARTGRTGTKIKLIETKVESDKLPPTVRQALEKIGLYMVILGFYTLYKDRVVAFFARFWRWQLLRTGTLLYHPSRPWYDPIRQQHWDGGQKNLEALGFAKVCDCIHTLPRPREYGRVMHKHAQVYILLMFAHMGRKRLCWFECFSMFVDGSAIYTTTFRDPNFDRPKEYPLFQVPESSDYRQVLMVHTQNVENSGKQLAMVAPDKILQVLSQLERTVLIHKPAEAPKKIGRADTAKPEPLLPPPLAPAPLPPSPLMAPTEDTPVLLPPPPLVLKPPPPVAVYEEPDISTEPAINPVTAAMAKYAANREASVLGIAAVAAEQKSEEYELAQAELAEKESFKDDVIERIQEIVPHATIKVRDVLSLLVTVDRGENELDLETPYYMSKSSPDNRAKIISGVAQRVKQGAY